MANLNEITFTNVDQDQPKLSISNNTIMLSNIDDRVHECVVTTGEALSRLYNGLYLIHQMFKDQLHLEETPGLMAMTIKSQLIDPLSKTYPILKEFEFTITNKGSIVGNSDVANTLLNALNQLAIAPVEQHDEHNLPQHKQVMQDLNYLTATSYDEYEDNYEDEYDGYEE